jgi:hypothetical protein
MSNQDKEKNLQAENPQPISDLKEEAVSLRIYQLNTYVAILMFLTCRNKRIMSKL